MAEDWTIPPWAEPQAPPFREAACRSCGAEILWVLARSGSRAPINRDGVSHFATCPQADRWRGSSRKEAGNG